MIKGNLIKGWITSIIGIITMIVSLLLVFTGQIDFVWDGVAGLSIGTVLLMAPQTIEKQFIRLFSMMSTKVPPDGSTYNDKSTTETTTNSRQD